MSAISVVFLIDVFRDGVWYYWNFYNCSQIYYYEAVVQNAFVSCMLSSKHFFASYRHLWKHYYGHCRSFKNVLTGANIVLLRATKLIKVSSALPCWTSSTIFTETHVKAENIY